MPITSHGKFLATDIINKSSWEGLPDLSNAYTQLQYQGLLHELQSPLNIAQFNGDAGALALHIATLAITKLPEQQ